MFPLIPKLLLFCFLISNVQIKFPQSIQIITNDTTLTLSREWIAGVLSNLPRLEPDYAIVAYHASETEVFTKIRIPQTLTRTRVIENILYYFLSIEKNEDRCTETLLIYPLFVSVLQQPFIIAKYENGGRFLIQFKKWKSVPVPEEPTLFEKKVYNYILQQTFKECLSLDSIPDAVFLNTAQNFDVDIGSVRQIFRKVYLWKINQ
ncbi:MAG: hypothetical protein GXO77_05305 [Calditrichaeota bacterium]|nr:hypothetical protein [Calditrichota bacterium]